jgi:hypothetical protein
MTLGSGASWVSKEGATMRRRRRRRRRRPRNGSGCSNRSRCEGLLWGNVMEVMDHCVAHTEALIVVQLRYLACLSLNVCAPCV